MKKFLFKNLSQRKRSEQEGTEFYANNILWRNRLLSLRILFFIILARGVKSIVWSQPVVQWITDLEQVMRKIICLKTQYVSLCSVRKLDTEFYGKQQQCKYYFYLPKSLFSLIFCKKITTKCQKKTIRYHAYLKLATKRTLKSKPDFPGSCKIRRGWTKWLSEKI